MLKLCGFAVSNYYNKVKLQLLEKGVPFEEELVWSSQKEEVRARSPMGKVPFIEVEGRTLAESQPISEYIEEAYPEKPLLPRDPFARAKVRELIQFLELHVELVARRTYSEAFFGGKVSDEIKQAVEKDLQKGITAFLRLAKFAPFVAGSEFTLADCAAINHLQVVRMATNQIYGRDFFADAPQVATYLNEMKERPAVKKVAEGRKAHMILMEERRAAR
jgi:glutathione S-transferase